MQRVTDAVGVPPRAQEILYAYWCFLGVPAGRLSFTICTFWMIKSLYKIGAKEEAERMFHQTLSYANHLGLFSEGIEFESKRLVGNFPQGYSHLALIDAAMTLVDMQVTEEQKLISLLRYPFSD